jgi:hypothetical protein
VVIRYDWEKEEDRTIFGFAKAKKQDSDSDDD